MTTTYRELRLANLDDAIGFSREQGSAVAPQQVRHNLSLAVHAGGEVAGYALFAEENGHHVVELALTDDAAAQGLCKPLADTALRKMQCAGYGTVRVRSLNEGEADRLWEAANWLERIPCWGAAEDDTLAPKAQADEADAPAAEPAQTS